MIAWTDIIKLELGICSFFFVSDSFFFEQELPKERRALTHPAWPPRGRRRAGRRRWSGRRAGRWSRKGRTWRPRRARQGGGRGSEGPEARAGQEEWRQRCDGGSGGLR